ncbi:MAG: MBL fold metallo-hydrolase [Polaribacter sp.]|uniref:MBL fold metallo-hydrolase n=1 Tax=Polaribacter sp. TaxID=1920175 RepID=UPI003265F611
MQLTVLTENYAGSGFIAEHGLSYLIEHEGKKVLFDVGNSDVFLKNANQLSIDIQTEIKTVVLSHGHWDHGNGLQFINNKKLITHPGSFIKRYRKKDNSYLGLKFSKREVEEKFDLKLKKEPFYITDKIIFLGTIPRTNNFESKSTNFIDKNGQPDFVIDDSALAIIQNNELIIVTACSHSGVCNIIEYATKITGIKKVKTVIGGFHLKHNNLQTQQTINYLKEKNIDNIYPSHCTQMEALVAFYNNFNTTQVKTGMILNL